jgi:hypothetical protein
MHSFQVLNSRAEYSRERCIYECNTNITLLTTRLNWGRQTSGDLGVETVIRTVTSIEPVKDQEGDMAKKLEA